MSTPPTQPARDRDDAGLLQGQGGQPDDSGGSSSAMLTPMDSDSQTDEAYSDSDTRSFMSSILSSVRRGVEENGRIYPSYGKHEYGMPVDERELDRMDLQHHKFTLMLDGHLFIAPIDPNILNNPASRVLDIGTGSGIWAIDMADKYPAEIVGCDVAAIQPSFVPPNCVFEIEDAESDWCWGPDHFDFVHGRDIMVAIRDWERLIGQAHTALRPGGWIQLSSTIPEIFSDDDTIPPNSAFRECCDLFFQIAGKIGTDLYAPRHWKTQMEAAGFQNVHEMSLKMPSGPWTKDKRLREIGACERAMLVDSLETFLLRGYTQVLGGSREELEVLCYRAREELRSKEMHSYAYFHIVWGQRV